MKWKIYLAIAAVFALGMVSGALLVAQMVESRITAISASSTLELSQRAVSFLDKELRLTDAQEEAVAAVLVEAVQDVEPLRNETRRRAAELITEHAARVEAELDSKQQERFEKLTQTILRRLGLHETVDALPQ